MTGFNVALKYLEANTAYVTTLCVSAVVLAAIIVVYKLLSRKKKGGD